MKAVIMYIYKRERERNKVYLKIFHAVLSKYSCMYTHTHARSLSFFLHDIEATKTKMEFSLLLYFNNECFGRKKEIIIMNLFDKESRVVVVRVYFHISNLERERERTIYRISFMIGYKFNFNL